MVIKAQMLVEKIMMLGLARAFACSSSARSAHEKTCLLHPQSRPSKSSYPAPLTTFYLALLFGNFSSKPVQNLVLLKFSISDFQAIQNKKRLHQQLYQIAKSFYWSHFFALDRLKVTSSSNFFFARGAVLCRI